MSSPQPNDTTPAVEAEDRGPALRSFVIVMLALAVASISLRFWSRSLSFPKGARRPQYWWDDWVALISLPFVIVEFALIFYMLDLGLGRHIETLPSENIARSLLIIYIVYFVYDTALLLTKASALLFFSRVFTRNVHRGWFNYAVWATHALNIAWWLGIVFATIFMCNPVAKNYKPELPGQCGSTGALWIGSAVPSVAIDLVILLLPLPKIWGLQMSLAQRSGLVVVFLLGYCVIIVSVGRLVTVIKSAEALTADLTYESVPALYWLCAEVPIILISICLPPMLSLGRHLVTNYVSPISSKYLAFVSSRRSSSKLRSQQEDIRQGTGNPAVHLHTFADAGNFQTSAYAEVGSTHSKDSERQILPNPPAEEYDIRAVGGRPRPNMDINFPAQSIRVGKTVDVSRQSR